MLHRWEMLLRNSLLRQEMPLPIRKGWAVASSYHLSRRLCCVSLMVSAVSCFIDDPNDLLFLV